MPIARGPLDVSIEAEPPFLEQDGIKLNRNIVRKKFSGDIVGKSEAQMVAASTATPGSAGYVAIEHFTGSVGGKSGSFVLQHHGLMEKGEAVLTVTIVPDSGTGDLAGISGTLGIDNDEGKHSYVLNSLWWNPREGGIPGVFRPKRNDERREATRSAGMDRRSNAVWVLPQAVSYEHQ